MHEIRIAKDLSDIVIDVAKRENLTKVTKVNICFGQMIQIVPEIFEFSFKEIIKDTIANDAGINIEILPVIMRCTVCNDKFELKDIDFFCNGCGSSEVEILSGRELFVKSIEGA